MKRTSDEQKIYTAESLAASFVATGEEFTISCTDKLGYVATLGVDVVVTTCLKEIRRQNVLIARPVSDIASASVARAVVRTKSAAARLQAQLDDTVNGTWTFQRDKSSVVANGCLMRVLPSDTTLSTVLNGYERYTQRITSSAMCPSEIWSKDSILEKAIRYVCTSQSKKDVEPLSLNRLRVFCMQGHGCKYATAFPIPVAMCIMTMEARKLPSGTKLRVFDPCAGWGDRLAAAIIVDAEYVGMDPWSVSVSLATRIHATLGGTAQQKVVLSTGAQNAWPVDDQGDGGGAHLVFTSPPYGQLEQYGVSGTEDEQRAQAWKLSGEQFVSDFLCPMFAHAYAALCVGGAAVINIADTPQECLISHTLQAAESAGFKLERTVGMSLSVRSTQSHGQKASRGEPLFIFRKTIKKLLPVAN